MAESTDATESRTREEKNWRHPMSTKDVGWDDLSPPTIISCNNQNIGCDLPQRGSDHQSKFQLD